MQRGGVLPPTPVLAPGLALGSRSRVALSSTQGSSNLNGGQTTRQFTAVSTIGSARQQRREIRIYTHYVLRSSTIWRNFRGGVAVI